MKKTCKDCKWWEQHSYHRPLCGEFGFCRRFPPVYRTIDENPENEKGGLVNTFEDEWCGEFEAQIDSIPLPIDDFNSRVRRFLRIREREGKPVKTIEQFLSLSDLEILRTKCAGNVTLMDILDIQKRLKGIKANWRKEKADAAVKEALGID